MIIRIVPRSERQIPAAIVRSRLADVMCEDMLLTRIIAVPGGRLALEICDWDEYWMPVRKLESPDAGKALEALHCTWTGYIASGFDSNLVRQYCSEYASLLEILRENPSVSDALAGALRCAKEFECFNVIESAAPGRVTAAGMSTRRNPNYLKYGEKAFAITSPFMPVPMVYGGGGTQQILCSGDRELHIAHGHSILFIPGIPQSIRSGPRLKTIPAT